MTEHDISNNIRLELSKRGIITFRLNSGKIKMSDGRYFNTGLPPGTSDIFGVMPETGRAVFIEVKKPDHKTNKKHLDEQLHFLQQMRDSGALAGMAETVEQALAIVEVDNV